MTPDSTNTNTLPPLEELARWVVEGRLSRTQAKERIEKTNVEQLKPWLFTATDRLPEMLNPQNSVQLRLTFLELGNIAAEMTRSAGPLFNFTINLGMVLCGEHGEVERGIQLLEYALQLTQHLKLSQSELAQVILHVADAYLTHHKRMGRKYLEVGIQAYQTVIELTSRSECPPMIRAKALHGLGVAITEEHVTDQMVHASKAIGLYQEAIQLIGHDEDPHLYAHLLHNLGNAHKECADGDRMEHVKKAVACLEASLKIRAGFSDRTSFRFTAGVLAGLYSSLGRPMRAVELYEQALETLHPIRDRREYGNLLGKLGSMSRKADALTAESHRQLISLSTACFVASRESLDPNHDTDDWAASTAGLAAMRQRAGFIDDAVALQEEVFEKTADPKYARRRGLVAFDHIQVLQFRVDHLVREGKLAEAREVRDRARSYAPWLRPEDFPPHRLHMAEACLCLLDSSVAVGPEEKQAAHRRRYQALFAAVGSCRSDTAWQERDQLEDICLRAAIEVGAEEEMLPIVKVRLQREDDFLRINPSLVDYYNHTDGFRIWWDALVTAERRKGHLDAAWHAADLSRARSLDLLAVAAESRSQQGNALAMDSYVAPHVRERHAQLVREWQSTLEDPSSDSDLRRDAVAPWLRESLQQAPAWRGHWVVDAQPNRERIDPAHLAFPDMPTAIIEFACTREDACAFVLFPGETSPRVVPLPGLSEERQLDWIGQWFDRYGDFEKRGPAAIPAWAKLMDRLHREIGLACWAPLKDILESRPLERLIFIPDLHLDTFALQAMSLPDGKGSMRLGDRYEIALCPSLRQLVRSRRHTGPVGERTLFIGNPQEHCPTGECTETCRLSLPVAHAELAVVREQRSDVRALMGKEATPQAVLNALNEYRPNVLHLSTHGINRFDDPLGSGFILHANEVSSDDLLTVYVNHQLSQTWGAKISGEVLTLDTLLRKANLESCDLAILNACEVGLSYVARPRESLHVGAGLLAAKVPSVVAPLWYIAEAAAGLLTRYFYEELRANPAAKLRALTVAQRRLRMITHDEAAAIVTPRQLAAGVMLSGRERPFSHMFFWAPFQWFGSPS